MEAHHPGNQDPRVLAHRIRSFASCYGQVCLLLLFHLFPYELSPHTLSVCTLS